MQNRITVQLIGHDLPADYPLIVLQRLRHIYEENITSVSQLLPRHADSRGDVLKCYTYSRTHETKSSFLVVGTDSTTARTEDDMDFVWHRFREFWTGDLPEGRSLLDSELAIQGPASFHLLEDTCATFTCKAIKTLYDYPMSGVPCCRTAPHESGPHAVMGLLGLGTHVEMSASGRSHIVKRSSTGVSLIKNTYSGLPSYWVTFVCLHSHSSMIHSWFDVFR